jgi:hypothetical protein
MSEELGELVEAIQKWHQIGLRQLKEVTEHPDAEIKVGDNTYSADSDIAKGIRFGVSLSLMFLGKLPFTISANEDEDEDEDESN